MTRQTSKGTCTFCHREFNKASMTRHLQSCEQRVMSSLKINQKRKNFSGLLTSIACIASFDIPSEISQGTNRHNI